MDFTSWFQEGNVLLQRASGYLNTIVIALVILLGGFILGRIVDRSLYRLFLRVKFDDLAFGVFRTRRNYARATRTSIAYAIYVFTVYMALKELQLDRVAVTFVLALFVLIIAVSCVLAGIEIIPQLIGRWQLRSQKIEEGSRIEIVDKSGKIQGTVVKISLLDIRLKQKNGDMLFYPTTMAPHVKIRKLKK